MEGAFLHTRGAEHFLRHTPKAELHTRRCCFPATPAQTLPLHPILLCAEEGAEPWGAGGGDRHTPGCSLCQLSKDWESGETSRVSLGKALQSKVR